MIYPIHLHGALAANAGFVLLTIFLVTLGAALCIVAVGAWRRSPADPHLSAIQVSHTKATQRIGGVAILVGALVMVSLAPAPHFKKLLFLVGMIPLFLAGLVEDMRGAVSPRARLIAAAISSAIVAYMMQRWLQRAGLPYLDAVLAITPLAVLVTILGVTALTHAFNLIDGLHGLALGVGFAAALTMTHIADAAGDELLFDVISLFSVILAGLLVLNFPWGKIFLGDAGAYSIGFCLSWFAVMLIARNPDVAPVALVLIFFLPMADLLMTIWRRARRRAAIMAPDCMHFHQVTLRTVEIVWLGKGRRHISNPLATALMTPFFIGPMVAGYLFWNDTRSALLALAAWSAAFVAAYVMAIRWARKAPHRRPHGHSLAIATSNGAPISAHTGRSRDAKALEPV